MELQGSCKVAVRASCFTSRKKSGKQIAMKSQAFKT